MDGANATFLSTRAAKPRLRGAIPVGGPSNEMLGMISPGQALDGVLPRTTTRA